MERNEEIIPVNIIDWEQKHGIFRREVNGVTYIYCANFRETFDSIDRENRARYAREMNNQAHDRQAEGRGL